MISHCPLRHRSYLISADFALSDELDCSLVLPYHHLPLFLLFDLPLHFLSSRRSGWCQRGWRSSWGSNRSGSIGLCLLAAFHEFDIVGREQTRLPCGVRPRPPAWLVSTRQTDSGHTFIKLLDLGEHLAICKPNLALKCVSCDCD